MSDPIMQKLDEMQERCDAAEDATERRNGMIRDDMTQVVYMVANQSGDDMCGGFNLHGIYADEDAAQTRLDEIKSEDWLLVAAVYPIPLNAPGWLGYRMDKFESSSTNEEPMSACKILD